MQNRSGMPGKHCSQTYEENASSAALFDSRTKTDAQHALEDVCTSMHVMGSPFWREISYDTRSDLTARQPPILAQSSPRPARSTVLFLTRFFLGAPEQQRGCRQGLARSPSLAVRSTTKLGTCTCALLNRSMCCSSARILRTLLLVQRAVCWHCHCDHATVVIVWGGIAMLD